MIPFYLLVGASLVLRMLGFLGVDRLSSPRVCVRLALVVTFTFTGVTHFTSMRHDYARMIPPFLPDPMALVYASGALELLGAAGLLFPRSRKVAALGLLLLLAAVFPGNVHAHLEGVTFRGDSPTSIWVRAPVQLAFLVAVWYAAVRRRPRSGAPE
jgi:uncharacterized membrane protein